MSHLTPPRDGAPAQGAEQARRYAPVLETPRLRLRRHLARDLDGCWRMWSDPRVTEYMGKRFITRSEIWRRMLGYAGLWSFLDFGYWAVEEKASGAFVGDVGFADFRRDLLPILDGAPEAGWIIAPWAHGRGYATEAVRAVLAWADAGLTNSHSFALIHPENTPSLRVAEKCGFHEQVHTVMDGEPTILFERVVGKCM